MERATLRRHLDTDLPPVVVVSCPHDQALSFHAIEMSRERGSLDPELPRQAALAVPGPAADLVKHHPCDQGCPGLRELVFEMLADRFPRHDDEAGEWFVRR